MKTLSSLLAVLAVCSGCANFTTKQTDTSYDEQGKPLRAITTKAQATTFFDSKSSLASFKAQQTDKTQSASVGSLTQETTGGTNIAPTIDAVTRLLQSLK